MKWSFRQSTKFNLAQEFRYWYDQLKKEYQSLVEISSRPVTDEVKDDSLNQIIADRIEILNRFLVGKITRNENFDSEAMKQAERLVEDRQNFMDTTRKSFSVSHPAIINYLRQKELTEKEMNICCLYMIGLRSKEIGVYLGMRSHYNISSVIRQKLGLDATGTNLGIYLRRIMSDPNRLIAPQDYDKKKVLSLNASKACVFANAYFMTLVAFIYMLPLWVNITVYIFSLMCVIGLWGSFKAIYVYRRESILLLRKCSQYPSFGITVFCTLILIFCRGLIPENLYAWVSNVSLCIAVSILASGIVNLRTQKTFNHSFNFLCICYGAWSVVVFFIMAYLIIGFNNYNSSHSMPLFFEIFGSPTGIPWYFVLLWTVLTFFAGYGLRRYTGSYSEILSNFFGFIFKK